MNIVKNLVSQSKYSVKCPYSMTPEFVVVHNTANDATAQNEIKYMTKIGCDDMEYIMIVFNDLIEMPFPHFKKGKYYKGMEWDKEYSLEELGL